MGITKQTLRELLSKGTTLESIFEFKEGQDCLIFKAEKFKDTEDIIYIPDITLNEIEVTRPLDAEGIDHVIEHCCTNAEVMNNWLKFSLTLMTGSIHVFRIFWMVMLKKNFRRIMDVL